MPNYAHWALFLSATIILLLLPGPSVLFVVARGIDQGRRAALLACIGLALGDLFQVLCAAVGLSTILVSSVVLFATVKYLGAVYLIFLGIHRICSKDAPNLAESNACKEYALAPAWIPILQGFSANALNPKTALFFLAFLPQFISVKAGSTWFQIIVLGSVFVVLGMITNAVYGRMGSKLGHLARGNSRFKTANRYVGGGTLVALGVVAT
jgi:threonine/homoserine/homoserine lactone efflux protein